MKQLAIDSGGTFTDVVDGDGACFKIPSTPERPAEAILRGVERAAGAGVAVRLVHGTTVATNAVLAGAWSRAGLLVNRGFRDLLAIGRQARPSLYALEPRRPRLPLDDACIEEIPGRISPSGEEIEAFDDEACRRAVRRMKKRGAAAAAVLLLHSYKNPGHELRAGRILDGERLRFTLSSALNPEFREVERGLAALVNSSLLAVAGGYIERLSSGLPSGSTLRVMSSDAGMLSPEEACGQPARLLLSGPAGGLLACRRWGEALSEPSMLTLDIGGTSTDAALLAEGCLPRRPGLAVGGIPMRLPSLDLHTVGAGGGSRACRDSGGALKVGPESEGADPGPAAYGRGGGLTVTDAHLLAGRIPLDRFADGARPLDPAAAERAAGRLARELGVGLDALLSGVLRVADATMARALRVISLERGRDPRLLPLFVFGGAGGLHGISLARSLGVKRVVFPPDAGVLSAKGLLWAAPSRSRSKSVLLDRLPPRAERRALAAPLAEELRSLFLAEGCRPAQLSVSVACDLRYSGQSFEIEIPERGGDLAAAFHRAHRLRFGFVRQDAPVELVAVRVRVEAEAGRAELPSLPKARRRPLPCGEIRPVAGGGSRPVYDRADLRAGHVLEGPALVADATSTVVLEAGSRATVHRTGAILAEAGR